MSRTFVNVEMDSHYPMITGLVFQLMDPMQIPPPALRRTHQIQSISKFRAISLHFCVIFNCRSVTLEMLFFPLFYRDCSAGYVKNDQTGECDDIDECEGTDVTCKMDTQVCYNTPGSYKCLDILPVTSTRICPNGFKFEEKIKQCIGG